VPSRSNDILRKYEAVSALKEQSDAVRALGATSLYIFGSMVRDAATSTSDLGLFIDYDRNSRFSLIEWSVSNNCWSSGWAFRSM
jgi:predicted nucleotidyltransferase